MAAPINRDKFFMSRAIQLALKGMGSVSPNPMVGAVIVAPDGRIIGEGWHRRFGESHAEVNAVASVPETLRHLLPDSDIYVTLEPCSHYGKTPPCSLLLIRERFRRVIVGSTDPFPKVAGSGIKMIRDAGIDVTVGVMENECREINRAFFTAHTLKRPYITLKWAQSADGWMDSLTRHPYRFSTALSQCLVHRLRAASDAVLTSARTINLDDSLLDTRHWNHGHNPLPVVISRNTRINPEARILKRSDLIDLTMTCRELPEILRHLYSDHGITSLLVEGGSNLLKSFIDENLWDTARVEVNPVRLKADGTVKAPLISSIPFRTEKVDCNTIYYFNNPDLLHS